MHWKTLEHGKIPCNFRGIDPDGNAIIRVPDQYDLGEVELHVPIEELVPSEET